MKRKFKYRPYAGSTEYPTLPPQNIRAITLPRNQVQQFTMSDGGEYRRMVGTVQTVELELYYPQADGLVLEVLTSFYTEVGLSAPFRFNLATLYRNRNPLLEPLIKDILGVSTFRFKAPPKVEAKGIDRYDITVQVLGWGYRPWERGKAIDTTGVDLPPYSPKLPPRKYSGVHIGVAVKPANSLDSVFPSDWVWKTTYPASDNDWTFNIGVSLAEPTAYTLYMGSVEWLRVAVGGNEYTVYGSDTTITLALDAGFNNFRFTYFPDTNPVAKPALFFLITPSSTPASDEYGVFPNLVPSYIQDVQLSDFGVTETDDDRLFDEKRIKTFAPINTTLSLEFNALNSEDLQTLLEFYKESKASQRAFYLPSTVFSRFSDLLWLVSTLSEYDLWVFDSTPSIKTEITGLYSTSLRIRAVKEFDYMFRKPYKPARVP